MLFYEDELPRWPGLPPELCLAAFVAAGVIVKKYPHTLVLPHGTVIQLQEDHIMNENQKKLSADEARRRVLADTKHKQLNEVHWHRKSSLALGEARRLALGLQPERPINKK